MSTLRIDPTRTTLLRRQFQRELSQRFAELKRRVTKLLVDEDALGLRVPTPFTFNEEHKYASTQVNITDEAVKARVQAIQQSLGSKDVVKLEEEPHITVLYGLSKEVDAERVALIVKQHGPLTARLGPLSLFQNDDADVLKIDVDSPALEDLHRHLRTLPHTLTHEEYAPHLTVAYLQPDMGHKYVGPSGLEGTELEFRGVVFSNVDREHEAVTFNASECGAGAPGSPGFQPGNTCGKGGGQVVERDATNPVHEFIAEQVTADWDRLATKFPMLKPNPPTVKIVSSANESGIAGNYNRPTKTISLSELASPEDRLTLGEWTVGGGDYGSLLSSYRHELGHHLQGLLFENDAVFEDWIQASGTRTKSWQAQAKLVSKYAATNGGELFAESFAAYTHHEYVHGLLPKKIERFWDKIAESGIVFNGLTANQRWKFLTSEQKLEEFKRWLQQEIAVTILAKAANRGQDSWLVEYIERGYKRGMERAWEDTRKATLGETLDFYRGSRYEFLRDSFSRPVSVEKVKLLASRVLTDLKGVTEQMASGMSRELMDGMIQGISPREVARNINRQVDGIGRKRSLDIAITESTRAHAEGQLDAFERLGVEELGIAVEWSTSKLGTTQAGFPSPCKICAPLEGIVLKVSEAHGMLPRHPRCRCSFIPSGVGEKTTDQIRSQSRIKAAIDKSLKAERPKRKQRSLAAQRRRSRWAGAGKVISKKRPKAIV